MIGRPYVVVDVFARAPLEGNPLAVFPDASGLSAETMQRTALELHLSETAFVLPTGPESPSCDAEVRIFTPGAELTFAGHPVLGTAFVLEDARATTRAGGAAQVRLQTGAGIVAVSVERRPDGTLFGEMEHAAPNSEPFAQERDLLRALGLAGAELPVEAYRNGPLHVYVALRGASDVSALSPDLNALARLDGAPCVSCFAGSGTRFKTRMFAPGLGVAEDPATGSAAGPLLVHLTRHGVVAPGAAIEISQGEEIGRPSWLHARLEDSRVVVGGAGVIVARGEYRLQ